jgi:hypothetical protein
MDIIKGGNLEIRFRAPQGEVARLEEKLCLYQEAQFDRRK